MISWLVLLFKRGVSTPARTSPALTMAVHFSASSLTPHWPAQTQGTVNFPAQDAVGENWT